jgi:hypothetical protein
LTPPKQTNDKQLTSHWFRSSELQMRHGWRKQ